MGRMYRWRMPRSSLGAPLFPWKFGVFRQGRKVVHPDWTQKVRRLAHILVQVDSAEFAYRGTVRLHDASEHTDNRSDDRGVGAADRLVGVVLRLQADVVRLAEEALHGCFVLDHRDDDFTVTRRLR